MPLWGSKEIELSRYENEQSKANHLSTPGWVGKIIFAEEQGAPNGVRGIDTFGEWPVAKE